MRVWLVTFFLIFVVVEFYQWIQQFILPAPLYVFAGAFLAIASNYDKGITSLFKSKTPKESVLTQTVTLVDSTKMLDPEKPQPNQSQD